MTVPAGSPDSPPTTARQCNRCKEAEATLDLRNAETVCPSCFANFVSTKTIKRLEVMQREMRAPGNRLAPAGAAPATQQYLVALSYGPSSTALLHILYENLRRHEQGQAQAQEKTKKGKGQKPKFDLDVVHVVFDAAASDDVGEGDYESTERHRQEQELLDRYRARFPGVEIQTVDLSSIVGSPSVDWSALPLTSALLPPMLDQAQITRQQRRQQLAGIFAHLPSATSRADVQRLLTRHALLAAAADKQRDVVLLGHSTTALAELTLGEAAKGRGFSLPWLVNDGAAFPVPIPSDNNNHDDDDGAKAVEEAAAAATAVKMMIPVYYPLREIFRKELLSYAANTTPPLTELLSATNNNKSSIALSSNGGSGAVVSHKDLSIDDVMTRYFGEVEMSYPSVVANVVRTTGKLNRSAAGDGEGVGTGRCGLCGITLDKLGDERWRGELGEESSDEAARQRGKGLCYGCERSTRA